MSAADALKAARAAGIRLGIDGDDLVLEASAPPPAAVLDLLSRHKAGVVTLLQGQGGRQTRCLFGFTAMSGASCVHPAIPISNGKPPSLTQSGSVTHQRHAHDRARSRPAHLAVALRRSPRSRQDRKPCE